MYGFTEKLPDAKQGENAYAAFRIWSDSEEEKLFEMACFGPARLYVAGEMVFQSSVTEEVNVKHKKAFPVQLKRGWNDFIFCFSSTASGFGAMIAPEEVRWHWLPFLAPFTEREGCLGAVYSQAFPGDFRKMKPDFCLGGSERETGLEWYPQRWSGEAADWNREAAGGHRWETVFGEIEPGQRIYGKTSLRGDGREIMIQTGAGGTGGPLGSRGAGGAPDRRTGRRTRRRARGGAAAVRGARGSQIGHHFPTGPAAPVGWKVMIHSRIRSFSLDRSMWLCHIPAYAFREKMVPLPLPPDSGCATIFLWFQVLERGNFCIMHAFEFYQPTAIVFGPGTEAQAGPKAAQLGARRVLVVYGGQSAKASGLLSRVLSSLDGAGLAHDTFGGIHPNPRLLQAREGVQKALDFGADLILAVGGGSVIDASKAIALGAANPEADLWDFWQRKRPVEQILPIGVVLTISASGSETSDTAVLTHDETLVKRGLGSDLLRPKFAILDPELTYTLPPYQVSCGVVDIMMHTLDRYFTSVTGNLLTDEIAEGLLRTVITCGARAHKNSHDAQAMSELMWAGSLSHNDLTGLGAPKDFAPHQLGHELSARFDFAHGATLSAVWGSWAAYCWKTNPARFAQYGVKVWGLDPAGKTQEKLAQEAIARTVDFFRSLGMPTSLVELGCGLQTEEELEELARRCTFYGQRTIGAFRVLGYEDILEIYRLANH